MEGVPEWLWAVVANLFVAGAAVAPLASVVTQIIKVFMARLGLPEGYSGAVNTVVVFVILAIIAGAQKLGYEEQLGSVIPFLTTLGSGFLAILASLGWYRVGKALKVFGPVGWKRSRFSE
jgi:hypothetical protein